MYCICRFEGSGIWTREGQGKATVVHVQLLKKKAEIEPQPLTKENRPAFAEKWTLQESSVKKRLILSGLV